MIKILMGHASLDQLDTYAELCEEYLLGGARQLQREMLFILSPALPEGLIDRVLPKRRSLLAALSEQSGGRSQGLYSIIPMEDFLFSGVAYETLSSERPQDHPLEKDKKPFELLEIF